MHSVDLLQMTTLPNCTAEMPLINSPGVFYKFEDSCVNSITFDTCTQTSMDTLLALYTVSSVAYRPSGYFFCEPIFASRA